MIREVPLADARRRATRVNFMLRATLEAGGAPRALGRVRDLSATGMKIEIEEEAGERLARGAAVSFQLRGVGPVAGHIVWRRGVWLGVDFKRPIDPQRARKPVGTGETTPDYVKPVLVPARSLKYVQGL